MIKIIDKSNLNDYLDRKDTTHERETAIVKGIIADVLDKGDEAIIQLAEKFDGVKLDKTTLRVSQEEIDAAYSQVDEGLLDALRAAAQNIRKYHEKQKREAWLSVEGGKTVGQLIIPMESVGIYVPGGAASYPSSVLMNAIPAKVAGVSRIIMTTPSSKNGISPLTIVAAVESGVDEIYKTGGAQAVAALAYGTETIPKVDKIVGPGNIFVAMAKREVFGAVGIDMIAGPSEILVVADSSANPAYVAADMLSQAEHDKMAASVLVTDSQELADKTAIEIEKQLKKLSREDIARASIDNYGAIIVADDIDDAINVANRLAPEHLELALANPYEYLGKIKNAGAVFLGHYSPEPLGDYYAGPNHVLPTSGTARFFSVLSVDDYVKRTSVISYNRDELKAASATIIKLAEAEGLTAHANSVKIRFEE